MKHILKCTVVSMIFTPILLVSGFYWVMILVQPFEMSRAEWFHEINNVVLNTSSDFYDGYVFALIGFGAAVGAMVGIGGYVARKWQERKKPRMEASEPLPSKRKWRSWAILAAIIAILVLPLIVICHLSVWPPEIVLEGPVDEAWTKQYSDSGEADYVAAMVADQSGNIYLVCCSTNDDGSDYVTTKYDEEGERLWSRRYRGPSGHWEAPYDAAIDSSGNVYVTGTAGTVKYDPQGSQMWHTRTDGCVIVVDQLDNVYVSSQHKIMKYDVDGNEIWSTSHDGPEHSWNAALAVDQLGNVYATGGIGGEIRELSDALERLLAIERVRDAPGPVFPGTSPAQAEDEDR